MLFNFMPKDGNFQEIFSRASKNVVKGARAFVELLEKWDGSEEMLEPIHTLEREGDIIRHELVDKLNRTFITPFDREDIYGLSGELDDIIDMIQACSDRMQIFGIKKITDELKSLAVIVEKATILLDNAIEEMNDKKKTVRVLDYLIEVNRLENEGDNVVKKALRELFEKGDNAHALDIFKLKETYEAVEEAIDKCESVAHTIEGIVVKNT